MPSLNSVQIIGHLGKAPEMRFTPSGMAVTNFSVACTSKSKDKEFTEWANVTVWDKKAELCNQYLNKGSLVYVEGRLQTRSWDKEGVKHYKTEVIANQVLFLDKKSEVPPETEEAPF